MRVSSSIGEILCSPCESSRNKGSSHSSSSSAQLSSTSINGGPYPGNSSKCAKYQHRGRNIYVIGSGRGGVPSSRIALANGGKELSCCSFSREVIAMGPSACSSIVCKGSKGRCYVALGRSRVRTSWWVTACCADLRRSSDRREHVHGPLGDIME